MEALGYIPPMPVEGMEAPPIASDDYMGGRRQSRPTVEPRSLPIGQGPRDVAERLREGLRAYGRLDADDPYVATLRASLDHVWGLRMVSDPYVRTVRILGETDANGEPLARDERVYRQRMCQHHAVAFMLPKTGAWVRMGTPQAIPICVECGESYGGGVI